MIRWIIKDKLGTAPQGFEGAKDYLILDVRDMVDKAGNSVDLVKEKIERGAHLLKEDKPLIICCDYGISRSNAVAAGIMALHYKSPLLQAVKDVIRATGEKEIKIEVLDKVRAALGEEGKAQSEQKTNILITGASGFIGKNLCQYLNGKYQYTTLSGKDIDLQEGSCELDLLVREKMITHIIHLAAPRVYLSNKALGASLTMLRNILEACAKNAIKLIYPASWVAYSGYKSSALVASKGLPSNPAGPYGDAKHLCEALIHLFIKRDNLNCSIIRTCSLYGDSSDKPKFLWSFINSAANNMPIKTHKYLNGYPYIDLMNVDDFCRAVLRILETDYTGEVNVGGGALHSIKDIALIICKKLSSRSQILDVCVDDWTANILMDIQDAKRILNWRPAIALDEGIDYLIKKYLSGGQPA